MRCCRARPRCPTSFQAGALEPGLVGLGSPLSCCHLHFTFSSPFIVSGPKSMAGLSGLCFLVLLIPHRVSGTFAFVCPILNDECVLFGVSFKGDFRIRESLKAKRSI